MQLKTETFFVCTYNAIKTINVDMDPQKTLYYVLSGPKWLSMHTVKSFQFLVENIVM